MDAHVRWHAAADAYMDPESFRFNLNSLLESLRSVTLLLQNQKSNFADFDGWYLPLRDSMKTDSIMKWSLEARNRVVHQADLEIYSTAVVRLSHDWLDEVERILEVPPQYDASNYFGTICRCTEAA